MAKTKTDGELVVKEIISDLTKDIELEKEKILKKISVALNEKNYSFQQFNGRFGGKNNTYIDSVRTQFLDFDDYYAQWLKGMIDVYESDKKNQLDTYGRLYPEKSSFVNVKLIQDEEIEQFVRLFLERSFYTRLNERTRSKPDEKLWAIWFGYKLTYGLLIAPVNRMGEWTNDKSEIRRANYLYWTVGHILTEGLIDPDSNEVVKFKEINDFLVFYKSVLKRLSVSPYEQEFYDKYIEYLKKSLEIESEPLLIPEIRYAGKIKHHEHRLDFTILNVHTNEYTGFEISPASTHMSIKNLAEKQYKVNDELKEKWEKEMTKRNDYFKDFGITTVTFTDTSLANIDNCFNLVKEKLSARSAKRVYIKSQLERLKNI